MNRNISKNQFFAIISAVIIAAASLTSCAGIHASVTVPSASSSVTYQAAVDLPKVSGSNTAKVEYYFPRAGQKAEPQLISVINSAQKTLDIAIYSITNSKIGSAIMQAHRSGVAVRLITDREQASGQYQKALLKSFIKAGIPVKIDTHSGLMHLKVTIADGKIATTGSYNYTKSAEETNDEVFVILRDEKAAKDFGTEFEKMWNDSKSFRNFH